MSKNDLRKGLILLFQFMPHRIKKLEQYLDSHTRRRFNEYFTDSMELTLQKKETPKGANKFTQEDYTI